MKKLKSMHNLVQEIKRLEALHARGDYTIGEVMPGKGPMEVVQKLNECKERFNKEINDMYIRRGEEFTPEMKAKIWKYIEKDGIDIILALKIENKYKKLKKLIKKAFEKSITKSEQSFTKPLFYED